jgi:hypothetical protein
MRFVSNYEAVYRKFEREGRVRDLSKQATDSIDNKFAEGFESITEAFVRLQRGSRAAAATLESTRALVNYQIFGEDYNCNNSPAQEYKPN